MFAQPAPLHSAALDSWCQGLDSVLATTSLLVKLEIDFHRMSVHATRTSLNASALLLLENSARIALS